jgi:hypothetical protein
MKERAGGHVLGHEMGEVARRCDRPSVPEMTYDGLVNTLPVARRSSRCDPPQ